MSERDKLIEAMTRAIADANYGTLIWELYADDARVSLAAIEAAGWRIVPPDEVPKPEDQT